MKLLKNECFFFFCHIIFKINIHLFLVSFFVFIRYIACFNYVKYLSLKKLYKQNMFSILPSAISSFSPLFSFISHVFVDAKCQGNPYMSHCLTAFFTCILNCKMLSASLFGQGLKPTGVRREMKMRLNLSGKNLEENRMSARWKCNACKSWEVFTQVEETSIITTKP